MQRCQKKIIAGTADMILYKTINKTAQTEQIIEKSRFITHVKPAADREAAEEFFAEIKKEYKDATHNVPAMVIGDKFQIQWASDDGEPQGTSGAPIVQMLVNEGITNVAVVVTRYFGGIKLGTGGLVRAYTSSARQCIDAAGICNVTEMAVFKIKTDYSFLSKLQNLSDKGFFKITDIIYTDMITVDICCEQERKEEIRLLIANMTSGKFEIVFEGSELVNVEI